MINLHKPTPFPTIIETGGQPILYPQPKFFFSAERGAIITKTGCVGGLNLFAVSLGTMPENAFMDAPIFPLETFGFN